MLKFLTSTAAVLGLTLAQGNGNSDDEQNWYADCEDDNDYYVQTLGNSGQFTYRRCDDNQFLKIKIKKLQELESDGSTVNNKITSFTGGEWGSSGEDGSYVNYTIVDGDVTFTFYTRVLTEDEDFDWGTGEANELKWGFTVTGWEFEADTNQLEATFNFDAKGSDSDEDNDDDDDEDGDEEPARRRLQVSSTTTEEPAEFATVEWMLDGYPITAPEEGVVIYDDDSSDVVEVDVDADLNGKKATFTIVAPYFAATSTFDYDPLVGQRSSESGVGALSAVVAVVTAMFAALLH